jgi:ubiquitin-conjugating enzyme E2 N
MQARMDKRVNTEFAQFHKEKKKADKGDDKTMSYIDAIQIDGNARHIQLVIKGPKDSPYEGGYFDFRIFMTSDYPSKPPIVNLRTKIYHPNISGRGDICLNILKETSEKIDGWSPTISLKNLAISLLSLLEEPNIDDPLNINVTKVFKADLEKAKATAKEWTTVYASVDPTLTNSSD